MLLTADDLHLFNEGTHAELHDRLGAHPALEGGRHGVRFAVWAPDAEQVSVIGDFNDWDAARHPLERLAASGIWTGFVTEAAPGALYKYQIRSRHGGRILRKADPFGFVQEHPPDTASRVWDLGYRWGDVAWMQERAARNSSRAPWSVYEVHLGSWRRPGGDPQALPGYRQIAPLLTAYVRDMGFTHVELMPVMEHPFYGSWGYQATGYFAPSARYGTPQDLMYLIDCLHQAGIGVLLDWVPSHFPADPHGLADFDGSHLYEHQDPRQGIHPDWGSAVFNYARHEVRSFLLSSAMYWLDRYHADGLRVDAVASMLYLDYSRKPGEWVANRYGGRENLEAIELLRRLTEMVHRALPGTVLVAEESTSWPAVSRPAAEGGLGFDFKWDMGWMNDSLSYFQHDPIHRSHHHQQLTFRGLYHLSERFVLPLSHDEVVHGKGSLLGRMPGDDWQKFANLRLLLGWQMAQPGKKLLFMGCEFGQRREWDHDRALDWELLEAPLHAGVQRWVRDLNHELAAQPALHERDHDPGGFEWIDCSDRERSIVAFLRRGRVPSDDLACVFNFTPVPRHGYRIGVPAGGRWVERLNSDAPSYGGSGLGNLGGAAAAAQPWHGLGHSLELTLPPLAVLFLKGER